MDSSAPTLAKLDDRACADRLAALRWPEGFRCEDCGEGRHYRLARRPRVFECARCRHQQSVTAGTVLHRSRVPLASWFVAASLMMRPEGVSAAEMERRLGVTYETAWQLLHKLRAALAGDPQGIVAGIADVALLPLAIRPPRGVRTTSPFGPDRSAYVIVGSSAEGCFVSIAPSFRATDLVKAVRAHTSGPIAASGTLLHKIAELKPACGDAMPVLKLHRRLRRVLHGTHRSVSRAWLGRYLAEFRYRVNRATGFEEVLARALAAPWGPFSVRPALSRAA